MSVLESGQESLVIEMSTIDENVTKLRQEEKDRADAENSWRQGKFLDTERNTN